MVRPPLHASPFPTGLATAPVMRLHSCYHLGAAPPVATRRPRARRRARRLSDDDPAEGGGRR